jgi:hypothetical protein
MSTAVPHSAAHPSIQITFDGLLLFTFEKDGSQCVIETAKCKKHDLKIIIDGQELIVNSTKTVSIFSNMKKGVRQYRPGKVRHSSPDGDLNDLGWLMAIQGDQFHNDPKLPKNPSAIEQRIEVSTGIFYTALRTSDASIIAPSGANDSSTIATQVGCNITLAQGEVLNFALDGVITHSFIHNSSNRKIEIKYICEDTTSPDYGDFSAFYEIYNTVKDEDKFGVVSNKKLQLQRGLGIQNNGPTEYCPPAQGESPGS